MKFYFIFAILLVPLASKATPLIDVQKQAAFSPNLEVEAERALIGVNSGLNYNSPYIFAFRRTPDVGHLVREPSTGLYVLPPPSALSPTDYLLVIPTEIDRDNAKVPAFVKFATGSMFRATALRDGQVVHIIYEDGIGQKYGFRLSLQRLRDYTSWRIQLRQKMAPFGLPLPLLVPSTPMRACGQLFGSR